MRVLHTHEDAVFVDKPSGQLVHNSAWAGPRERTLVQDVREALGEGLHPVHRIDRGASGVLLFARDMPRWQRALSAGRKHYLAIVRGHLHAAVDIDHPVKDENGVAHEAKSRAAPVEESTVERCSLVDMELFSGRHHQARKHLSHITHPILGDSTHGKGALNRDYAARFGLKRLALHAWSIELPADEAGTSMLRVVCPPGDDFMAPLALLFSEAAQERARQGP